MSILRKLLEKAKDYDCSVCGSTHARSGIRVLGKLEATWILRVTCAECEAVSKVRIVEEPTGMLGRP